MHPSRSLLTAPPSLHASLTSPLISALLATPRSGGVLQLGYCHRLVRLRARADRLERAALTARRRIMVCRAVGEISAFGLNEDRLAELMEEHSVGEAGLTVVAERMEELVLELVIMSRWDRDA